ncbi:MAG: hypothetical protein DRG25_04655 [Deltaproteobacteria bacterium]|nr:MAG: hypothetical protein DRG25_04655 [Deltaproteobacteria bacterium]
MNLIPEWAIWIYMVVSGFYGLVVVPYYGSKLLTEAIGKSEDFWFLVLIWLNIYSLIFILLKYRRILSYTDKRKLIVLLGGYIVILLLPIIAVAGIAQVF